jgi:hypothetical protein
MCLQFGLKVPSRPGNFDLGPLLSIHPARAIVRRLPFFAETAGSSRFGPVGPRSTTMPHPSRSMGIIPLRRYNEAPTYRRGGHYGQAVEHGSPSLQRREASRRHESTLRPSCATCVLGTERFKRHHQSRRQRYKGPSGSAIKVADPKPLQAAVVVRPQINHRAMALCQHRHWSAGAHDSLIGQANLLCRRDRFL